MTGIAQWIANSRGGRAGSATERVTQPRRAQCRCWDTQMSPEPVCAPQNCSVHPGIALCTPELFCARGELSTFHVLPVLEGEGAEEQGEGWLELSPHAHLPEWVVGGPTHASPSPAHGGALSQGRGTPVTPAAPFCLISGAGTGCRGDLGVL